MNFCIVGYVDRPERRHVAQEIAEGSFRYMHHDLAHWKTFTGREDLTDMKDFGFDFRIKDGQVIFEQVRKSTATYEDGKHRPWQDVIMFTLPLLDDE